MPTLEQRVSAILADLDADWESDDVAEMPHEDGPNVTLAKRIFAAVREAVMEEREAALAVCREVAEYSGGHEAEEIASRIRERTP